jgi:hypothetical protein
LSIGDDAFAYCSGLKNITIPNSVNRLGARAFNSCLGLTSITSLIENPFPLSFDVFTYYDERKTKYIALPATLYVPIGTKSLYEAAEGWNAITSIVEKASPITFADANVKALCVANWDTNGDGELSEEEATAVTSLGEVFKWNTKITSFNELQYFKGLTSISDYTFANCNSLTSIIIPENVTSISKQAFICSALSTIKVDANNTVYDSRNNCNAVIEKSTNTLILGCKTTTIPESVTIIGPYAYAYCTGLSSITIPETITSIGEYAFCRCDFLTSAIIGNHVESLGDYAFSGCQELANLTLGNGLQSIGEYTFQYCKSLKKLSIPENVNGIGKMAFYYCDGLQSITLPQKISTISENTFSYCSSLTSITIPEGVTHIGERAFESCYGLTSVSLPKSITEIGAYAFLGCTKLQELLIPDNVISIGNYAFSGCTGITAVNIPQGVTSIGEGAFYGCSSLNNVTSYIEQSFDINDIVFEGINSNCLLYVPYGCKIAYEATDGWKDFKKIVEIAPQPTDISTLADAIYIEPFSGRIDDDVNIEVKLKNAETVTSYGFELVLPEGMSIKVTSDKEFDNEVTLNSNRHNNHTVSTNKLDNGNYKVAVASMSSKALADNDGLVLTIKSSIDKEMALGNHPIKIVNPLVVYSDATKPTVKPTLTTITIEDYMTGDVDGDGTIDLADAVLVINYYVGKTVTTFNAKAADVDGDGVIDLADAVKIISYYVGKIPALAPRFDWNLPEPE